jgi:hypothetical protein
MRLSVRTALLLFLAWLALPAALMAQSATIRVRITDLNGKGVSAVLVTLRDGVGQNAVGEATTNEQGEATFEGLDVPAVRLSVSGQTPSGKLISLGEVSFLDDDAMLVRTDVGGPDVPLVMDNDGYVYLKPEAIVPDTGEPEAATAVSATPQPGVASTPAPSGAVTPPARPQPSRISLWLLFGIGGLLTALVVSFSLERRVP